MARVRVESRSERVRVHLAAAADVTRQVAEQSIDAILAAADVLADTLRSGGKILLCGNGGSAADCQHLAAEFVNRLNPEIDRPGLPAIALTTDTSFLTAFANDSGFDGVFERQVRTLGKPGDTLIGISTSGNSRNVLRAFEAARQMNIRTIALTGLGGHLGTLASVAIAVPSASTQRIQEAHLAIEHVLCYLVEQQLFSRGVPGGGASRSGSA